MKYRLILILVICLLGCEKDNSINTIRNLKAEWMPNILDTEKFPRTGIKGASITYGRSVLFGGGENGELVYYMINGETGETEWKWNDFIDGKADWRLYQVHQYDKYMIAQEGRRNYCLDLSNGTTVWKKNLPDDYGSLVWGIDEYYFIKPPWLKDSLGHNIAAIYYGKVLEDKPEEFLLFPPYDDGYYEAVGTSGTINNMHIFKSVDGDILINMLYIDFTENGSADSYLGLYNFTKREWIYDRKRVISNGGANYYVYEDKVYLGGTNLTICDIYTGTILHTQGFAASGNITRMLRVDDKLILEKGGVLYAIDPTSGSIIWETFSGHNISFMREMNSVIYFTSSGDGKIHAVDVPTGQHYWHSDSPDGASGSRGIFTDMVTLLSGKNGKKGRVYTSSYANGYCYEAVK